MGVTKKEFSGGIYVDVILVHIKTRLDLLGIQTFRWDQRLQLQNFFMALGRHLLEVVYNCFLHSAHWLPTRKKLLYTVANPARGLLNRGKNGLLNWGKKKKSGSEFGLARRVRQSRSASTRVSPRTFFSKLSKLSKHQPPRKVQQLLKWTFQTFFDS